MPPQDSVKVKILTFRRETSRGGGGFERGGVQAGSGWNPHDPKQGMPTRASDMAPPVERTPHPAAHHCKIPTFKACYCCGSRRKGADVSDESPSQRARRCARAIAAMPVLKLTATITALKVMCVISPGCGIRSKNSLMDSCSRLPARNAWGTWNWKFRTACRVVTSICFTWCAAFGGAGLVSCFTRRRSAISIHGKPAALSCMSRRPISAL